VPFAISFDHRGHVLIAAGSGSVSGYAAGASGSLSALGNTSTDAGTVDAAAAAGGEGIAAS
jgi:hypothetical protein